MACFYCLQQPWKGDHICQEAVRDIRSKSTSEKPLTHTVGQVGWTRARLQNLARRYER